MTHDYELAAHALAHKSAKKSAEPMKHLKEFHAKELHTGGYTVTKHSGKPGEPPTEHGAPSMADVHDLMEEHLGQPNDGEAQAQQEQPSAEE